MKIDDRVSNYMAMLVKETSMAPAHSADALVTAHSINEADSDTVTISPSAEQLADDTVRRIRLDLIRQQLAEGTYNISGKDVADKMLSVLKETISTADAN